ncbi:MAG: tyrosine-type recombinase/integrase [Archaeoglobus sp.]|nr:tyrosine-type recombinase/integrase [Archaeoglobus sp.]
MLVNDNQKLPTTKEMLDTFANFLRLDVANGDASEDTVKTYHKLIGQFVSWCRGRKITPLKATKNDIKEYRRYLVETKKHKPATIALKLSVVRRFYEAALEYGIIKVNPAIGVNPPREKKDAAERINYLDEVELKHFLASIPKDNSVKSLRDRALIAIMALQGPRTVEMHRANVGDIVKEGNNWGLRVEGKRSIRTIPLRPDIAKLLLQYLEARKNKGEELTEDSPLFVSIGNRAGGKRISRRSIRRIVDFYLEKVNMKRMEGRTLSAHSLRHTAGTLSLRAGADLRQVQDLLGHKNPKTTAIYAHVGNRFENNPALGIPVKLL